MLAHWIPPVVWRNSVVPGENGARRMFLSREDLMKSTSALASALVIGLALIGAPPGAMQTAGGAVTRGCQLAATHGQIQHVIYIQFDNVHFTRDDANVPSDLEQMPHLLNFIRENGTLLTNHHTVLISHTATGIRSSLTAVCPARPRQPVASRM